VFKHGFWRNSPLTTITALALLLGAMALVYKPWQATALEMRDFSEFVPIMVSSKTGLDQFRSLSQYYLNQGRANAGTNAMLVGAWKIAGLAPAGWQWLQLVMLTSVGIVLMATLRARRVPLAEGALLSAAVMLSAAGASAAMRPTAEAPATLFAVIMFAFLGRSRAEWTWVQPVGIAVCAMALLSFKEVFIPLVAVGALTLLLGYRRRRQLWLALLLTGCVLLASFRALQALGHASASAYARGFASEGFRLDGALQLLPQLALPSGPLGPREGMMLWGAQLAACILLLLLSLRARVRGSGTGQIAVWALWTLCGCAIYAAWGRMEAFYGLPFEATGVLILGTLLGKASETRQPVRIATLSLLAIVCSTGAIRSLRVRDQEFARRAEEGAAARELSRLSAGDTVFVRTQFLPSQEWQSPAATFARYRRMSGESGGPILISRSCVSRSVGDDIVRSSVYYLTYEDECGRVPAAFWRARDEIPTSVSARSLSLSATIR
jgi:hypothetical protein